MITIRIASPMPTRPCRFCLALQDDSVFADFDIDPEGHAFVIRISYDGFGCCECETNVTRMSCEGTQIICAAINRQELGDNGFQKALLGYLRENADVIWKDALKAHGLLVE